MECSLLERAAYKHGDNHVTITSITHPHISNSCLYRLVTATLVALLTNSLANEVVCTVRQTRPAA